MGAPPCNCILRGERVSGSLIPRRVAFSSRVGLTSQLIGAVDPLSCKYAASDFDGLLGLGPRQCTSRERGRQYDPIPTSLTKNSVIPAKRFSVVLNKITTVTTAGCYLTFGGWPKLINITSA